MKNEIPASRIVFACLILCTILAAFSPLLYNQSFVWDDEINICRNDHILSPNPQSISQFWAKPYLNMYIPVTYTAWSFISLAGQALGLHDPGGPLAPQIFHIVNLILHFINGLLVFILLDKLVKNRLAACAGALFFALHPVQAETVAYITELKTLLAFAFSLGGMNLYYTHRLTQDQEKKSMVLPIPALGLFTLAILSKPVAVVVPVFIFVINMLILDLDFRKNFRDTIPWLLIVVPFIILTKSVQPPYFHQFVSTIGQRFLIYGDGGAHYLYKALCPVSLGIDYGRTPEYVLGTDWGYFAWIVPALVAGGLVLCGKRARPYLAGVLIFIAGFGPVSGLVPFVFQTISTVTDRYMYFSMLGLGLAGAFFLARNSRALSKGLALAVLVVLAIGVSVQVRTWDSNETLYTNSIRVNSQSALSYNNLAARYMHNTLNGILFYHRALTLKPDYTMAAKNLCESILTLREEQPGLTWNFLVQPDKKFEAESLFYQAVNLNRAGDYPESCRWMGKALVINIFNEKILNDYGVLCWRLKDFRSARTLFQLAAELAPENPGIAKNLLLTLPGPDSNDTKAQDLVFFHTP